MICSKCNKRPGECTCYFRGKNIVKNKEQLKDRKITSNTVIKK
jgi:hypothetical protein